jgi:hypothetical protein
MRYEFSLPTKADRVPTGRDWLHEVKYDGYRMMRIRERDRVRLISRGGYDLARHLPLIVEAALNLRQQHFVIDGEAVVLGPDGVSDDRLLSCQVAGIFPADYEQGDIGHDLFHAACRMGLEGIVSKRLGSTYRSGQTLDQDTMGRMDGGLLGAEWINPGAPLRPGKFPIFLSTKSQVGGMRSSRPVPSSGMVGWSDRRAPALLAMAADRCGYT